MPDRLFPDLLRFFTPSESIKNFAFDFSDDIPTGDSIKATDSTVTAVDDAGADVSSSIVSGKNVSGTQLRANLAGWEADKNYLVTFRAVMTNNGEAFERHLKVKCRSQSAVG